MPRKATAPVMFRKEGDHILAVFPTVPSSCKGDVTVYAHVGQHSGAEWAYIMTKTQPAEPSEYAALARELRQIGYRFRPIKRRTSEMLGMFNAHLRNRCS
jgi:hypothetical protein